jgi:small subunit ribosomal protein S20
VAARHFLAMANTKSAAKRARQSVARSIRNRSVRAELRTLHRRARTPTQPAADEIRKLIATLDKAAKRGIIHRNAANRRKARLNKLLASSSKK